MQGLRMMATSRAIEPLVAESSSGDIAFKQQPSTQDMQAGPGMKPSSVSRVSVF